MGYSRAELDQMAVIAAELADAAQRRPLPRDTSDLNQRRKNRANYLAQLRHLLPTPFPGPDPMPAIVYEEELLIPSRDGHDIKTMLYRPADSNAAPGPLVLLFHEGGWMIGDLSDEAFSARLFVRDFGVTCINVEYRLAPENPFPAAINDCWDAVQWAAKHASDIHAAPASAGFIVGGSSAGGATAAVLAHLSRNTDLTPPVTGQWLSVPYLMDAEDVPAAYRDQFVSADTNEHDPVLSAAICRRGGALDLLLRPDVYSPLFAPLSRQGNYPNDPSKPAMAKAFIQVAGVDPLRDGALIYDQILRNEYGADTRLELYSGYCHMFWTNWPEMKESGRYARDLVQGMKWLLEK